MCCFFRKILNYQDVFFTVHSYFNLPLCSLYVLTQKLLGRLCEQNRMLKDYEAVVHRLRMDKVLIFLTALHLGICTFPLSSFKYNASVLPVGTTCEENTGGVVTTVTTFTHSTQFVVLLLYCSISLFYSGFPPLI